MHRSTETLRLFKILNDDAASEDSNDSRSDLGATHLDEAILSSADEHDVLLYMQAAAAPTRCQKQNTTFNARAFCSYAVLLLHEGLRGMHSTSCKEHSTSFDNSLCKNILLIKTSSLPLKRVFLDTVIFFSSPGGQKRDFGCSGQDSHSTRGSRSEKTL